MKNEIDLTNFLTNLKEDLSRYFITNIEVNEKRFPSLKEEIQTNIKNQIKNEVIMGPFVEMRQNYKKDSKIKDLIDKNILTKNWENLDCELLNRSLYSHQVNSIKTFEKNNYIVSTGTGSGKTECFLYPIINDILKNNNFDGIKAIFIYPLNALANDQLFYRIAKTIIKDLKNTYITFGIFTGDTEKNLHRKDSENEILKNANLKDSLNLENDVPNNWLLTRKEMFEKQPNILITNYAMLEHILLLPNNKALFKNCDLKYLVLDEIHTYNGAQAIDVAFLLRKLKASLNIEQNKIRCIGTSATLDANHKKEMINFVSDLFGEKFNVDNIIEGKYEENILLNKNNFEKRLDLLDFNKFSSMIIKIKNNEVSIDSWNEFCEKEKLNEYFLKNNNNNFHLSLGEMLSNFLEIGEIIKFFNDKHSFIKIKSIIDKIFNVEYNDENINAFNNLLFICSIAKVDNDNFLFNAKYHIAISGVGKIHLSLLPDVKKSNEKWDKVDISKKDNDKIFYNMLVCKNCGEVFIEGFEIDNKILSEKNKNSERVILQILDYHYEETIEDEEDENSMPKDIFLDVNTGDILNKSNDVSIKLKKIKLSKNEDNEIFMKKCSKCGYKTITKGMEILNSIQCGDMAISAVSTSILFENMPNDDNKYYDYFANNKKTLIFSDNRQDAAFFAPFFEKTTRNIVIKNLIINILKEKKQLLSIKNVRNYITNNKKILLYENFNLDKYDDKAIEDIFLNLILKNFAIENETKNSLESSGLVYVDYERIEFVVEKLKLKYNFIEEYNLFNICRLFLDWFRGNKSLTDKNNEIDFKDDFVWDDGYDFAPKNTMINAINKGEHSLISKNNKYSKFQKLLIKNLNFTKEECNDFIEYFCKNIPEDIIKEHKLNINCIKLEDGDNKDFFECDKCGLKLLEI